MDQLCPRCESMMNEGETDVEFYDDVSMSITRVSLTAIWCDSCDYHKIREN